MKRLAIITTHPIQYYAPVFQALAKQHAGIKVFYTWGEDSIKKYDPDFQKNIEWDIPLLEGYDYEFLKNTSSKPGTSHFNGIVNPDAIKAIDAFRPDALLVYGWSWRSHMHIIRHYAQSKKVWFRGDSTLLDATKGYKKAFRSLFLRWVYRHVDLAFYVGSQNKKYFRAFGLKENQLRFAPHSIDNSRFSADCTADALRIREELQIPPSGILILYAGKLEPKKDPFTLLAAFEQLPAENVFLLFAGNGILEKEIKARAETSIKKDAIRFLDFQNQSSMPALYQACQVYCLPSVGPGETWGLAVNEAMAAGKAVLVSHKVGCSIDLVQVGVNGYIFEGGNTIDLHAKLERLTDNPQQIQRMGDESAGIIDNWSFQHQTAPILEELKQL